MKLLIFYLLLLSGVNAKFSCKNHDNQEVSWYIIFYIPAHEGKYNYYYYDSLMSANGETALRWIDETNINDDNTPIAYTLNQYYSYANKLDVLSIIYNDEPADGSNGKGGHMKGALHYVGTGGYYMLHSIPGFIRKDFYFFPGSGTINGQHIFCSSIEEPALENIAHHLYITDPKIYSIHVPTTFLNNNQWLAKIHHDRFQQPPFLKKSYSFEIAGTDINVYLFSKAERPFKHLWLEVLKQYPGQKFDLTSWSGKKTRCRNIRINNIKFTYAKVYGEEDLCWGQCSDHSKYSVAITEDPQIAQTRQAAQATQASPEPIICLSDLNFAKCQQRRSGGIYCLKEEKLVSAIRNTFRYLFHN